MSSISYEKAIKLLTYFEKREDLWAIGPCSLELIEAAQKALGLSISGCYLEFVLEYGALSFGSEEISGIVNDDFKLTDDFTNSFQTDAVSQTLDLRKTGLPHHLFMIYNTTWGEIFCLDYSNIDAFSKEPTVVTYYLGFDHEAQNYEIIARNFGDFLLDRVTEAICVNECDED
ncbi:hypothetical protein SY83_02925 [Paenibacillus swuensis]|uniref:Knr4/Smi1-like domain-containing protein n=1 Tax=Paenibacillus swuensis TaxID=1178515 RepID=A0A172TEH7_9BACL|nr:SMI1/KNR4 family protein [Paenibacillus swuensis]ANE45448.1 hypothetical protein SY83_02925 [Paenibacillus swuensis]